MITRFLLITTFLFTNALFAQSNFQSIVPDNDLWIGPDSKSANLTISEKEFNDVIDSVYEVYAPVVAELGGKLEVVRKWDDGTVNAYAQREGNVYKVTMFGGLARHEAVTADGFALVLCHEIGHHLGGAPKIKRFFTPSWATNEGQSDYWATLKCMRNIFEDDNNVKITSRSKLPQIVSQKCSIAFRDSNDVAICKRNALAGQSLANLFKVLRNLEVAPQFDTPDATIVRKTSNTHPDPQCRLDTYFAGAICPTRTSLPVDDRDQDQGVCSRLSGYDATNGARPLCWFKP